MSSAAGGEAGVPLWRAFAGVQTLHPQWAGYAYTWMRDKNAVQSVLRERDDQLPARSCGPARLPR